MALSKTHLLISNSYSQMRDTLTGLQSPGLTLQNSPAYTAVVQAEEKTAAASTPNAGAPNGLLFYFDTPALFARTKNHFATALQDTFGGPIIDLRAQWAGYTPPGQKVAAPTSANDGAFPANPTGPPLRPGTISLRTAGPGFVAESTLGAFGNMMVLLWFRSP